MRPRRNGTRFDWNDVLMSGQEDGLEGGIRPFPVQNEIVLIHVRDASNAKS